MDKKTSFILLGIIAVFAGIIGISTWQNNQNPPTPNYGQYRLQTIRDLSSQNDYSSLDLHSILPASEASGNLPENIIGDADAPIVIYEYADYQCSYCAILNPLLNKIVEDYKGKVAIVYRSYVLDYHDNSVHATSAANAAALQGYWKEYKDLLFSNQADWFYSTRSELQQQLENYFVQVSDNKGDLTKFREDIQSEAVAKKTAFDYGIADKIDIGGTPWLYLDGEWISNERTDGKSGSLSPSEYASRIRSLIDQKLH